MSSNIISPLFMCMWYTFRLLGVENFQLQSTVYRIYKGVITIEVQKVLLLPILESFRVVKQS